MVERIGAAVMIFLAAPLYPEAVGPIMFRSMRPTQMMCCCMYMCLMCQPASEALGARI